MSRQSLESQLRSAVTVVKRKRGRPPGSKSAKFSARYQAKFEPSLLAALRVAATAEDDNDVAALVRAGCWQYLRDNHPEIFERHWPYITVDGLVSALKSTQKAAVSPP